MEEAVWVRSEELVVCFVQRKGLRLEWGLEGFLTFLTCNFQSSQIMQIGYNLFPLCNFQFSPFGWINSHPPHSFLAKQYHPFSSHISPLPYPSSPYHPSWQKQLMSPSTCHLISSQTSINHATSAAAERGRMTQLTTIMLEKKNQLTSYLISCVWRKFHFWLRVGCCLLFFCASYSILLSRGGWGRVGHWLCSVIIILFTFIVLVIWYMQQAWRMVVPLSCSFAATFSERVTRTVRKFSPHLAAKMRPRHMWVSNY